MHHTPLKGKVGYEREEVAARDDGQAGRAGSELRPPILTPILDSTQIRERGGARQTEHAVREPPCAATSQ